MDLAKLHHARFDEEQVRWKRLLHFTDDAVLTILRGHLLIEEQLQGIIDECVHDPSCLEDARLTYFQKLRLSQAIAGFFLPVVWEVAGQVNTIRNYLAHNADSAELDVKLEALFSLCSKSEHYRTVQEATGSTLRLHLTFRNTLASLSAFRACTAVLRLHR